MAIPFYEPRSTETAPIGDQVDGHGSPPGSTVSSATANSSQSSSDLQFSVSPAAHGQVLAWKILAVAMCKALKEYYSQNGNTSQAFTNGTGGTPAEPVLSNEQMHPLWK